MQTCITNGSSRISDFQNAFHLVSSLESKIHSQINQINPSYNSRSKRGLINGLGSIVKSLTGNLDQEDAQKYDRLISKLSSNQGKIKSLINEQTTLMQKSITNFENLSKNISQNQLILENRIEQAQIALKQIQTNNTNSYGYFLGQVLISQVISAFQNIYDILENLEIAITFSKLNIFHSSIVNPEELLSEIKSIESHLHQGKLPFPVTLNNILSFERIIEIKCYTKENKIFFIIEIPIVEPDDYILYHLYPIPVSSNNIFQIIIPRNRYLILNEHSYSLFNDRCQETSTESFICKENSPLQISEDPPCEVQLLQYSQHPSNCQPIGTTVESFKLQNLENEKWLLVFPEESIAIQQCGKTKENIPLKGTFVLELNPECTIRIQDVIIRSHRESKSRFRDIQLPKLTFEVNANPNYIDLQPVKLNSINLDELKGLHTLMDLNQHKLEAIPTGPVHFRKISLWTMLLYIIIFCFLGFLGYRKWRPRKNPAPTTEGTTTTPSQGSQFI